MLDFKALYGRIARVCHGENGHGGPAMELGNAEYQALVDDATLRKWISGGMPGTQMLAFAQSAGGMLTDAQVNALIAGMRKEWAKPNVFGWGVPAAVCAARGRRCEARGAGVSGAVRELPREAAGSAGGERSVFVAGGRSGAADGDCGREDRIGQPDWRLAGVKGGTGPLSGQDVTDVVTYLGSLRNAAAVSAAPTGR